MADDVHHEPGSLHERIYVVQHTDPKKAKARLALLLNLLKQGKIKPIVATRMPLNQAAQAHELLASGSVQGKIVLTCNG